MGVGSAALGLDGPALGGASFASAPAGNTLSGPNALALAPSGVLYVADTAGHCIRAITCPGAALPSPSASPTPSPGASRSASPSPLPLAAAPTPSSMPSPSPTPLACSLAAFSGQGAASYSDGPASTAQMRDPFGLRADGGHAGAGALLLADTGNHRIRRVFANGSIATAGGNGVQGADNGAAPTFSSPKDALPDAWGGSEPGAVLVADDGNARLRVLYANRSAAALAGSGTVGFADGAATAAAFRNLNALLQAPGGGGHGLHC